MQLWPLLRCFLGLRSHWAPPTASEEIFYNTVVTTRWRPFPIHFYASHVHLFSKKPANAWSHVRGRCSQGYRFWKGVCVTINPSFFIVDGEMLYPRLELFYLWLLNRTISVRVLANIIHNDSMNNLRSNRTFMYPLKYVTCVRNYREMDSIRSRRYAVARPQRRVVIGRCCAWKNRDTFMFTCKCLQINIASKYYCIWF